MSTEQCILVGIWDGENCIDTYESSNPEMLNAQSGWTIELTDTHHDGHVRKRVFRVVDAYRSCPGAVIQTLDIVTELVSVEYHYDDPP